jgi:hypothetical protein
MKVKKLIFWSSQSLAPWNYKRFNISFLNRNFDFEYWDISFLISNIKLIDNRSNDKILFKKKFFFNYFNFIYETFKIPADSFLIDLSSNRNIIHILIKNILFLRGVKFVYFSIGNYVQADNSRKYTVFFKKIFTKYYLSSIMKKKLFSLLNFFTFYKYCHYFIGGSIELNNIPKKKITYSHVLDYNDYIQLKNSKKPMQKNFIVYLDQKYLDHPEFNFLKEPNFVDIKLYKLLNFFFKNLSKKQNKKIVFCAHPRAKKNDAYLKNFKNVKFNKTSTYVKYADLVMAHDSISINYAVIFKKPILLIDVPGMENTSFSDSLNLRAELLGCKIISLKNFKIKDLKVNYYVDHKKYNEYQKKYIKFMGEDLNSWKIFKNKLYNF